MKGRHIRSEVRRRLSDFIKVEDAKVGRKNVLTVSGMIGASALGSLFLAVQNAYADSYSYAVCCPLGQAANVVCRFPTDNSAQMYCGIYVYTYPSCPEGWTISCAPYPNRPDCYIFTCSN